MTAVAHTMPPFDAIIGELTDEVETHLRTTRITVIGADGNGTILQNRTSYTGHPGITEGDEFGHIAEIVAGLNYIPNSTDLRVHHPDRDEPIVARMASNAQVGVAVTPHFVVHVLGKIGKQDRSDQVEYAKELAAAGGVKLPSSLGSSRPLAIIQTFGHTTGPTLEMEPCLMLAAALATALDEDFAEFVYDLFDEACIRRPVAEIFEDIMNQAAAEFDPQAALAELVADRNRADEQRAEVDRALAAKLAELETGLERETGRRQSAETEARRVTEQLDQLRHTCTDNLAALNEQVSAQYAEIERLRAIAAHRPTPTANVACLERAWRTPKDAVEAAAADFPLLVFHPNVWASLARFEYPNPVHIYTDLARLHLVAARWHAEGTLAGGVESAVVEAGITNFTRCVSATTVAALPNSYVHLIDDEPRAVGPHFGRGARCAANCYRAYCVFDETSRRIIVCHVGQHLPDSTYNN